MTVNLPTSSANPGLFQPQPPNIPASLQDFATLLGEPLQSPLSFTPPAPNPPRPQPIGNPNALGRAGTPTGTPEANPEFEFFSGGNSLSRFGPQDLPEALGLTQPSVFNQGELNPGGEGAGTAVAAATEPAGGGHFNEVGQQLPEGGGATDEQIAAHRAREAHLIGAGVPSSDAAGGKEAQLAAIAALEGNVPQGANPAQAARNAGGAGSSLSVNVSPGGGGRTPTNAGVVTPAGNMGGMGGTSGGMGTSNAGSNGGDLNSAIGVFGAARTSRARGEVMRQLLSQGYDPDLVRAAYEITGSGEMGQNTPSYGYSRPLGGTPGQHKGGMITDTGQDGNEETRRLLEGEFVMTRQAVGHFGPELFETLNRVAADALGQDADANPAPLEVPMPGGLGAAPVNQNIPPASGAEKFAKMI